eukprot:scaffold90793_cov18-Prasinocladus_malaysianus.AAC.1
MASLNLGPPVFRPVYQQHARGRPKAITISSSMEDWQTIYEIEWLKFLCNAKFSNCVKSMQFSEKISMSLVRDYLLLCTGTDSGTVRCLITVDYSHSIYGHLRYANE